MSTRLLRMTEVPACTAYVAADGRAALWPLERDAQCCGRPALGWLNLRRYAFSPQRDHLCVEHRSLALGRREDAQDCLHLALALREVVYRFAIHPKLDVAPDELVQVACPHCGGSGVALVKETS